jgi:hypothetical protein
MLLCSFYLSNKKVLSAAFTADNNNNKERNTVFLCFVFSRRIDLFFPPDRSPAAGRKCVLFPAVARRSARHQDTRIVITNNNNSK